MKSISSLFLLGSIFSAYANPLGPEIIAGDVAIESLSPATLQITTENTAIINWKEFSIDEGELTHFIQPSPTSAVLNRVLSGNPSTLAGLLKSNGQVYLVNPNGIFVTEHAVIDTNSFIAQTFDFADEKFLAHDFSTGPLFVTPLISDSSFETAIRHSGKISATTLSSKGGHVYLISDKGTVEIDGRLEAPGGEIRVVGEYISLSDRTQIDTSSPGSGGKIFIGGDFNGSNQTLPSARQVSASSSASILANSTERGDGGNVVIWSEDATQFLGRIEAKGGEFGGNGGAIEVSGRQYLDYQGLADATAKLGKTGSLLLDPYNITLGAANINVTLPGAPPFIHMPTGAGSTISIGTVNTNLATADVIIESSGSVLGLEPGNVIISTPFPYNRPNNLTFRTNHLSTTPAVTAGDILIQAAITNTGAGNITFDSVQDIYQAGVSVRTAGNLSYLANRDIYLGTAAATSLTVVRTTSTGNVLIDAKRDLIAQAGLAPNGTVRVQAIVNGAIQIVTGRDCTLTTTAAELIEFEAAHGITVNTGGILSINPTSQTGVHLYTFDGPIEINVGSSFLLGLGSSIRRDFSDMSPITITTASDFKMEDFSLVRQDGNGDISLIVGGSFTMNVEAACTTGIGSILATAGQSILINDLAIISTDSGSLTLVADNNFPNPPGIGTAQFVKAAGATLSTTGPLLIYTTTRNYTSISGLLNGQPYNPGPEFVDTDLEIWGIYYPHNSGFPYTIFYKNIFVSSKALQAFNISTYEFLQGLETDLFDRFFYSVESFDIIKTKDQGIYWELDPLGRYFYLRKQILPYNMYWFDHSYSEKME